MARLSSIDKLPAHKSELVRALRRRGETIDSIRSDLARRGVHVSRSALGRHVQHLDAAGDVGLARELAAQRRRLARIEAALAALVAELRRNQVTAGRSGP